MASSDTNSERAYNLTIEQNNDGKAEDQRAREINGRYESELLPFLPVAGGDLFYDSPAQRREKALNQALFNNIIRDPETGDCNINPLQMGIVVNEAIRFSGDNRIFDMVMPGGSLNEGAQHAGTERLLLPTDTLRDWHAKIMSERQVKTRLSQNNDYIAALRAAAAKAMGYQHQDVQWTNNNGGNRDSQHTAEANNTMPIEPDMWTYRTQMDGVVPLQNNLLPADALQDRPFGTAISRLYNTRARESVTFNPNFRHGWNPGTPWY